MTYGVNIRSRVEVLATGEDIRCLGKRDQCREGKDSDNIRDPESSGENQICKEKRQKRS